MRRWKTVSVFALTVLGAGFVAAACAEARDEAAPTDTLLEIRVDPGVELLAILFHMAGRDEYNMTRVTRWETAVNSHFARYAEHPAVEMTERLAGPYDVGYFVPMNLAVHLGAPPALAVRSPLAESPSIHRTWTTYPDTTARYLELVRSFARATRFEDFLSSQRALIDSTEVRLRRLVDETVETAWFDEFWGVEPGARFVLVPGLTNGRASYGVEYADSVGRELYAITGVMETDDAGIPTFGSDFTATVVHELSHPYSDPLVEAWLERLRGPGEALHATDADAFRRQAIGSGETLVIESLVRATVARYRLAREGAGAMEAEVAEQVELGFDWMPDLVALLGEYEADRDRWPTMEAFMPRIVEFFEGRSG